MCVVGIRQRGAELDALASSDDGLAYEAGATSEDG
jgi:hypothetical protein